MNETRLNIKTILKSKLARRLVPILMAVVAVPIAMTVLTVGHVAREQIVTMTHTMERINGSAVKDAGKQFQQVGQETVRSSGRKMAEISLQAGQNVSKQWEKSQADSIAKTGDDFARVTQNSFDGAMRQSLSTNRDILSDVNGQMGRLFASSAHYTQARVADRVQTAMLDQSNRQMQERARQLAQLTEVYLQTNQNYLALTAQMLNVYDGDRAGEKAVLDALVRRFPMFTLVSVMSLNGQETAMSVSDQAVTASDLSNHFNTEYFRAGMRGDTYVGLETPSQFGRAPVLRLAVPVELYRGKVIGVLSARLSMEDLWDTIRNTHIGKNGYAYVTGANGAALLKERPTSAQMMRQVAPIETLGWKLVVAQPSDEVMSPVRSFKNDIARNTQHSLRQMNQDIHNSSEIAATRLQKDAGRLHTDTAAQVRTRTGEIFGKLQRKTNQQTSTELKEMQEAIRSQAEQAQQDSDRRMAAAAGAASAEVARRIPPLTASALHLASRRLSVFALAIILISCAVSCVIGLFLASVILRPILRLAQGTRAIAQGELDKRVDERAPAEIGDLAVAFNTMAESLQQSRTELDTAEAQLVQSAKLASLGTLSAGVAHELNQPVAIVRGISQQLQGEPNLSPDVLEDLALIEGQTGRMMKIIKHLRTFCRAGGYEMVPVTVDQVVENCFILIDAQLKAHDISVKLDLKAGEGQVMGDANELEQVFINLITNARDAMEGRKDGEIAIRSWSENGHLCIEFHDNGTGIPEEVAAHIFDPFFTTKEAGKGTGLGLSISHGILQKHKGQITTHNDGGAVFTITLPLLEADTNEQENELRRAA
ncbi:MAG: ATP-binding protein [Capsulimonas sp.]|uniref:sensor histidine kinase n=1 Tax=Capsulimonas sp. TaxID=2494211 RepID=UPI003265460B